MVTVPCLNELSTPVCLFTHGGGERPMQYQRPGKHDTLMQCWTSVADGAVIWRHRQGQCMS